ncbi:hypothetical protein [Polaromonas sp. CG_23.6]|uniref:hypothetical protein n=1 Tax=Polaromonas sp. CG_23.6 TaxID=2760709 RepID=UPI002474D2F0|nr:hypothetical protein [Polaromonas sp. CG_23.6]MDH6185281.1 hypothetical protein [Polaromonas sp. CG_23.6]
MALMYSKLESSHFPAEHRANADRFKEDSFLAPKQPFKLTWNSFSENLVMQADLGFKLMTYQLREIDAHESSAQMGR